MISISKLKKIYPEKYLLYENAEIKRCEMLCIYLLKYDINVSNNVVSHRLQNLINQIYKLLPIREEGADWTKPLETILEELAGMQRLMNCGYS